MLNLGLVIDLMAAMKSLQPKEKHLRTTQQRMVIIEDLRSRNNHPSTDELYDTTVYEIIDHNLEFTGLCPDCTRKNRLTDTDA